MTTEGPRVARQTFIQRTAIWIPAAVIGLMMLPFAATSRTFGNDWTLHLWLIRQQEMNIQANHHPGLFVSAKPLGAFYPVFTFVGSGIYTVGAYLALALGDRPIVAYKLLHLVGLCLAYGGMTWLSWQLGLRGWRSQMPGLAFVTGAYFITNMYGRGDFGEMMALAAIPFLVAAVGAAATSRRLQRAHLLAVTVAVFVLTGSHNITLLYGVIFLTLLALVMLVAYAPSRLRTLPWKRLPAVGAAAAIGVGLNAWYLLPDLRYGSTTVVARRTQRKLPVTDLSDWRLLLDPLRPFRRPYIDIRPSLPWLFAVWAIVVAVVAWRQIDRAGRRMIALLAGLAVVYGCFIVARTPWKAVPHVLYNIQFTLRLHSYVLLATALLLMVVLGWQARTDERTRRVSSTALALIVGFTVVVALWQMWAVPSTYYQYRKQQRAPADFASEIVAHRFYRPPSWYETGDFHMVTGRVVRSEGLPTANVPEDEVRGSTFTGRIKVPPGFAPFLTDIAAPGPLARISGIRPIGVSASGFVVAEREPGAAASGPVDVAIRRAPSGLLRFGALVSLLSLGALAAFVLFSMFAWLRARATPVSSRR